jgi:hypothetical protein
MFLINENEEVLISTRLSEELRSGWRRGSLIAEIEKIHAETDSSIFIFAIIQDWSPPPGLGDVRESPSQTHKLNHLSMIQAQPECVIASISWIAFRDEKGFPIHSGFLVAFIHQIDFKTTDQVPIKMNWIPLKSWSYWPIILKPIVHTFFRLDCLMLGELNEQMLVRGNG